MDEVLFMFLSSLHKSGCQPTPPHQKVTAKENSKETPPDLLKSTQKYRKAEEVTVMKLAA